MSENEIRCFGPPGTGKTTWVADRVRDTARARGTDRIIACSFTKAAAAEMAGRDMPIPDRQVGTLHSLAYRAIDRPAVADERLVEWNDLHPGLRLSSNGNASPEDVDAVEGRGGKQPGDEILARIEVMRAKMKPRDLWGRPLQLFMDKWEEWKADEDVVDYTDMNELALLETERAPGDPLVGFFDEVQDFTPLELALIRKWGQRMERVVLAGDDDQCIYSFKGATPKAFLEPAVGSDQKRLLSQSYRVPRAVHSVAMSWVSKLTERERKDYQPRDEDGLVRLGAFQWNYPQSLVKDVEEQVSADRSVMILTSTGYMLDKIKGALRDNGIPFHNPYRRRRGDWNPLKTGGKQVSSADRLIAYLTADPGVMPEGRARPWTGEDIQRWASIIQSKGIFARGAKQIINAFPSSQEVAYEDIVSLFVDDYSLNKALEVDIRWFRENLLSAKREAMNFPLEIVERRGVEDLLKIPKVTIGTIHSVKGGQADIVYLFPDLSFAGFREWSLNEGSGKDSVIRLFYVGMTRSREELVICEPSTSNAIPLPRRFT